MPVAVPTRGVCNPCHTRLLTQSGSLTQDLKDPLGSSFSLYVDGIKRFCFKLMADLFMGPRLTRIVPGSAAVSSRAARLTASPKARYSTCRSVPMSPITTSPVLIPTRSCEIRGSALKLCAVGRQCFFESPARPGPPAQDHPRA